MVASIAAPNTIEKLLMIGQKLANEASLVVNFKKDFPWVTGELTFTNAYLKDFHQKSTENDLVKEWLGQLRDELLTQWISCTNVLLNLCIKPISRALGCFPLIFKFKIRRIRDLKDRIKSIVADGARLHLFRDLDCTEQTSTSSP